MRAIAISAAIGLALGMGTGAWLVNNAREADLQRYETRIAKMQADHATAVANANAAAIEEMERAKNEIERAKTLHTERLAKVQSDADSARRAADRLRADLATRSLQLSQLSEQAVRRYAAAANNVFGQCASEYQRVAQVADQCIADLRLMQDVWPQ